MQVDSWDGLSQWPRSDVLTWWNHKGWASTINHLIGFPSLLPEVTNFTISSQPIGFAKNHPYLHFKVRDEWQKDVLLRTRLSMLNTNFLGKQLVCINVLSHLLHYASTNTFPHITASYAPRRGRATQNSLYDEECCETGESWNKNWPGDLYR